MFSDFETMCKQGTEGPPRDGKAAAEPMSILTKFSLKSHASAFCKKKLWNMRTRLARFCLGEQTRSKRSSTEQRLSKHNWETRENAVQKRKHHDSFITLMTLWEKLLYLTFWLVWSKNALNFQVFFCLHLSSVVYPEIVWDFNVSFGSLGWLAWRSSGGKWQC